MLLERSCGPSCPATEAQGLPKRVEQLEDQVAALTEQVESLEAKTQSATLFVDCDAGQKINDALAEAAGYVGQATVFIYGTCIESVQLNRSHTSLIGVPQTTGATIQAPPSGDPVLAINSALGVFVRRLTLTGGDGVGVGQLSDVFLFDVRITDHVFHGLFVNGTASVLLLDSFVERNGGAGVFAWNSAHVSIVNTLIADNGEDGLDLQNGASAQLQDGTHVTGNVDGIRLWYGSSLSLHNNTTIDYNGQGIRINVGSTVVGGDGVFIQDNTGDGVDIGDSSTFVPGPSVIQRNGGWGVNCRPSPEVPQLLVGGSLNAPYNGSGPENCPVDTP